MIVFRPLQLSFNQQVLEQNRKFYFTASATLGFDLQTGDERLDLDFLKDMFEGMQENSIPDVGMPKPNGEFLVSGHFFAPGKNPVKAGEIKVNCGTIEKKLFVFGPRKWQQGFPSEAEPVTSIPLESQFAFGGKDYEKNPNGIGFNDGILPQIENPRHLIGSKNDKVDPAGVSQLYPMLPQRMQFQGTYDADYKEKYFPGYPEDHDWRFFLCAPADQWIEGYYTGNEAFALKNMHPDIPLIEGVLPGLAARCFINRKKEEDEQFGELPLNLDTIWFFPEKELGILIFRGVTKVEDDEAEDISHILLAYEDKNQPLRSFEYYKEAFEKRKDSDDELLKNLNTQDLIPDGHKSAMQILMDMAFVDIDQEPSELVKNIEAKKESMQKEIEEKIEESVQHAEKGMEDIPGEEGKPDIRKLMDPKSEVEQDSDVIEMNKKLEAIMPGITSQDPRKMDMTNASFDVIDEIQKVTDEFVNKKKKDVESKSRPELEKSKQQINEQINSVNKQIQEIKSHADPRDEDQLKSLEKTKKQLDETLKTLDNIDFNKAPDDIPIQPLPRIDTEELMEQMSQIEPGVMQAAQHVETMKAMGIEDEATKSLEDQLKEVFEKNRNQVEKGFKEAVKGLYEGYWVGAHFMEEGLSPHKEPVEEVKKRFEKIIAEGGKVSDGDWACVDFSGQNFDGIDFSHAYLEQVNFKGASLKGANFSKAILARANFENADLTGANLKEANIGAVKAMYANFSEASLKSAKLSKGDFTGANFSKADLEDIEALDIVLNDANFHSVLMPKISFVNISISGAKFINTDLNTTGFINCELKDTEFLNSNMNKCVFIDTKFSNISFNSVDLSNGCFVATQPEKSSLDNTSFKGSSLKMANFQNMSMQNSDLTKTDIENAYFGGADLSEANLSDAKGENAQFRKAKLINAKLDRINLDKGSLAKANLVGASFKGANLYAVDFLRSTITNTDFTYCNLDSTLIEHWRPE